MRLVVDSLIALMLAIILGCVLVHRMAESRQIERIQLTQQNMSHIMATSLFHASLHDVERSGRGYPLRIATGWFDPPPRNILAEDAPGWIDVAAPDCAGMRDPLTLVADKRHAGFWYNPYRGILRARVPRQMTDHATVELYNRVNGTSLPTDAMITSVVEVSHWP